MQVKSASKTKSVSAKKGKVQGVQGSAPPSHASVAGAGKNLTFENPQNKVSSVVKQGGHKYSKGKTPEEMWYDGSQPAT